MCKISVIVPVYNAEDTLETALSSVFMQTLTDIEILCINDGSTDHSADVLTSAQRRDGRVRCLTQENAGAGIARNKGIAEAKGEYIAFLDADDLYPGPYALETLLAAAEKSGAMVCGGSMRPSYYADLYRRFQTYVRDYGDNHVFRIACGPGIADDYNWTEEVMRIAGNYMNGLSLHYYTVPGTFEKKTAATGFDTNTYYETIRKALYMDELITRHTEIMSRYDPEHKVGLVVDEWGTWYDVEPGTNPGFLYQQNTMRDAIVAAVTLNIFNAHSDRVVMANIAQLVNVLQSVILTEGEKMVLTPTYHVFDLYKHHHDATLLNSHLETEGVYAGVPNLTVSASEDENGVVHITLANISADTAYPIDCTLTGKKYNTASARILTNSIGAYNDFDHPEDVKITDFDALTLENNNLHFNIPACAVMEITVS